MSPKPNAPPANGSRTADLFDARQQGGAGGVVEAELHRQNFRRLVAIEYEKEGDDDVRDDMRTNVAFAWQYGFSGA